MDALPQVGQKYTHKKWGEVEVRHVIKRGRGYTIYMIGFEVDKDSDTTQSYPLMPMRLKEFQKATACKP